MATTIAGVSVGGGGGPATTTGPGGKAGTGPGGSWTATDQANYNADIGNFPHLIGNQGAAQLMQQGYSPGEIAAQLPFSGFAKAPVGGKDYAPGTIAGKSFPTWNITPGNKVIDPGNQIGYSTIPFVGTGSPAQSPNPIPGSIDIQPNRGIASMRTLPFQQQMTKFGTGLFGMGTEQVPATQVLAAQGMQHGGHVDPRMVHLARLRALMRMRRMRRRGGRLW